MSMEQLTVGWPIGLQQLHEHIRQIPADDESELRIAVHDLHSFATELSEHEQDSIDTAVLLSCSTIIQQSNVLSSLFISEKTLGSYRDKPYIRSINALVRTLLPKISEPQNNLCFNGLQLNKCELSHLELSTIKMRGTDLSHVTLSHAILDHADLSHANLMSASVNHVDLHHSKLIHCEMGWCDLTSSILHHAHMMDADLGGAILYHADLSHALLYGAYLANATLNGANLSFAKLFAAQLNHAKLQGTNLTGTGITQKRLEEASMEVISNSKTIWGLEEDCEGRNPLNPDYYEAHAKA